jgi:hypothetical protein
MVEGMDWRHGLRTDWRDRLDEWIGPEWIRY